MQGYRTGDGCGKRRTTWSALASKKANESHGRSASSAKKRLAIGKRESSVELVSIPDGTSLYPNGLKMDCVLLLPTPMSEGRDWHMCWHICWDIYVDIHQFTYVWWDPLGGSEGSEVTCMTTRSRPNDSYNTGYRVREQNSGGTKFAIIWYFCPVLHSLLYFEYILSIFRFDLHLHHGY